MLELWQGLDLLGQVAAVFACLGTLTAASIALGFAAERSAYGRRRRIWDLPLADGQYRWEGWANVRFVLIATPLFALALTTGAIRLGETTPASFAATLGASWLFFEVYYYGLHRALHAKALLRFHRLHHRSQVTTPLSGLSMSTVETLGWMVGYLLPLILLSRWLAVSLDAFAAYLIYHWGGNILGHINAELMPRAVARGLLSYAAHPFTYHSLHHARWTGHFGLYSTFMDRAFGTEWKDWPALHEQVMTAGPMTSLKAQGALPSGTGERLGP